MGEQDMCPHLDSIGEITKDALLQKSKGTCQSCGAGGPNLWACLQSDCPYVGCGESFCDHSTLHAQAKKHNLTVNLTTFRVWCYVCEREVFLEQRPVAAASPAGPVASPHSACHHSFKSVPIAVAEDEGSESEEDELKPRGMKNIGNSCYMNAALQALSNCPPLTQFFLDCSGLVRTDKKPALCKSYYKLVSELWHKKRPSYVVPTTLSQGIKLDTQEFLRCLMDQLHEELKEPLSECALASDDCGEDHSDHRDGGGGGGGADRSPSEDEFLSCDSGSSSDHGEGRGPGGSGGQDEFDGIRAAVVTAVGGVISVKERLKERRVPGSPLRGGSQEMDEDADVDTAAGERRAEGGPQVGGGGAPPVEEPSEAAAAPPEVQSQENKPPEGGAEQTQGGNTAEPNNEMSTTEQKPASQPSSPVRALQDLHPRVSCSPPRSSPLRSAYSFKKAQLLFGGRKKKQSRYRSVISDIFDGSILSLVQCLTCDRVSTTVETFQDLSLPIPGKEDLAKLHSSIHQNLPAKTQGSCPDSYGSQGWIPFIMDSIRRFVVSCTPAWLWGPMIGSHVAFPLEGLDLRPFLAKDGPAQVTTYDLLSVICHHGTAGSGHYIAYCQNVINGQWYEFDDQYVTEVHETWLNKFQYLHGARAHQQPHLPCQHGGIPPNKYHYIDDLVVILPQNVFGGGPAVNHLYMCAICQVEIETLSKRRKVEVETFIKLNKEFQAEEAPGVILCISMQWFREWEGFVKGKDNEPPGPIDNSADYGQISEETWLYLLAVYGGGPEIAVRQTPAPAPEALHGERKIEAETRAL
ncbi:hypothetical protein CRUP_007854 [Coryphaenoides rupestris]|nr:hypothetical protein CRUP_007854 [Coryphaenoides rupestris]